MVRSALLISAPVYSDDRLRQLVASPEEFEGLQAALNDTRIGGFGKLIAKQGQGATDVKEAILKFFHNREPVEFVVLYLTGYELVQQDGDIYFRDEHTDSNRLDQTAIPARYVRDIVQACKAERKLLIIDCFSREDLDQHSREQNELRLADFSRDTHSIVLTSQDTLKTIRTERGKKNPGFTESLVAGISTGEADLDGRGYITEDEIFLYVYKRMSKFGTAPNLFMTSPEGMERVRLARNVKFSKIPTFTHEDDSLNFARFLRLISQRRKASSGAERATLNKVLGFQPESTFLRRLLRAAVVTTLFSGLAAWITSESISKTISIALIVLAGLILDDLIRRRFS